MTNNIKWSNFDYYVSSNVFIPKDSSLYFLDQLSDYTQNHTVDKLPIIDICCGIGAIGITAYLKCNYFNYFLGLDNDQRAIDICNKNINKHQINGKVLLWNAGERIPIQKGIAVCNPPFIPINTIDKNTNNINQIASNNDGLEVALKCFESLKQTEIILILKSLKTQIKPLKEKVINNFYLQKVTNYLIAKDYEISYTIWSPIN